MKGKKWKIKVQKKRSGKENSLGWREVRYGFYDGKGEGKKKVSARRYIVHQEMIEGMTDRIREAQRQMTNHYGGCSCQKSGNISWETGTFSWSSLKIFSTLSVLNRVCCSRQWILDSGGRGHECSMKNSYIPTSVEVDVRRQLGCTSSTI